MNKDLLAIFDYLEKEKGIKRDIIITAIEESLLAAAKKSVKGEQKVKVTIDQKTGDIDVYIQKLIVKNVENADDEISLEEARTYSEEAEIGRFLEISITPQDFGRIAAQTAKQIITQKLRGAERDVIYEEYRDRVGEIISGGVKKYLRSRNLLIDLGKVEAILPDRNYPPLERYHLGERVQALLLEVRDTENGGAEVILSRSHADFVAKLFEQEVPELSDGVVSIDKIVREAGYRTKIAVSSTDRKVDPVGTCVGVRGTRIKNIIREINNEKIDVFPFTEDKIELLRRAVSPIEIQRIKDEEDRLLIIVKDDDYPTVLGKKGMNARLIGKLLECELKIQRISEYEKYLIVQMLEIAENEDPELDNPLEKIEGMSSLIVESLKSAGFDTYRKVLQTRPQELASKAVGINFMDLADKMITQLTKK